MVKSRKNASKKKRQQNRRKSVRKRFSKMLRGGGLVDNFTDESLKPILTFGSEKQINNTIERLREKDNWEDFLKDYKYGDLLNPYAVKSIMERKIIEREEEERQRPFKEEEERQRLIEAERQRLIELEKQRLIEAEKEKERIRKSIEMHETYQAERAAGKFYYGHN